MDPEKYELEFRYTNPRDGKVHISINPSRTYYKGVEFIIQLLDILKNKIPFKYNIVVDPTIAVLAGQRVNGMISVQMCIEYSISDIEAELLLKEDKWLNGFEFIK